jgi:hypothetical protein
MCTIICTQQICNFNDLNLLNWFALSLPMKIRLPYPLYRGLQAQENCRTAIVYDVEVKHPQSVHMLEVKQKVGFLIVEWSQSILVDTPHVAAEL